MTDKIIKWKQEKKLEFLGDIYLKAFGSIFSEFDIKFKHHMNFDDNHIIVDFKKNTDWTDVYQDRTFNCIYPIESNNLKMIYVDKNEAKGIHIEPDHYYVFPYWLSYKLFSEEESNQKVLNFWYWSDVRIKNKRKGYYW